MTFPAVSDGLARTVVPTTTTRPETPTHSTTTSARLATTVTVAGDQTDAALAIHLAFLSEVEDVTYAQLASLALAVLNDPRGWNRSGFTFVADEGSDLTVVLAEPERVDELCLPLETRGAASCQNGAIVALNAQRWRTATEDWDSSVEDYRTYLVNHEVGHLIGLRHPADRCPPGESTSAVMEPQTAGLAGCAGNGWPLPWEIEWAAERPAVIGPTPEWDGPRPTWP